MNRLHHLWRSTAQLERWASWRWLLVLVALGATLGMRPLAAAHAVVHPGHNHAHAADAHADSDGQDLGCQHGHDETHDWGGHQEGDALCQALELVLVLGEAPPQAAAFELGAAPRQPVPVALWPADNLATCTQPRARGPPELS